MHTSNEKSKGKKYVRIYITISSIIIICIGKGAKFFKERGHNEQSKKKKNCLVIN